MDSSITQLILQDRKIAYVITDPNLKILAVSDEANILPSGYQASLGCSLLDLEPELIGCEEALADVLAGELPRFELAWVNRETPAGQTIYLTLVELPHRNQEGRITGLIHLVEDVTEVGVLNQWLAQQRNELRLLRDQLARQNLELAAANTELQRLDELKSMFVSIAAHELRTPLTLIRGYGEMLLDGDLGPLADKQRDCLEIIERSASRLLTITSNLLDVTRIETERIELVLKPIDLPTLVQTLAAEFGPELQARVQRLTLRASSDLPPALGDETRAAQIIGNLLSNASRYTSQGGLITVDVTLAEEAGFLQISVADNGVGISAGDQAKLFSRFFRAESPPSTEARGAGLGLYITRALIELHGGRIWFESELGRGSTFHVTFPVADRPV
ncbi:MAG: hybrid sensor histidine kinase/response regulator [Anaerolineae bacterium]|nr:hybrid sensor histidine kinase/response regulator [Anaerolineae bacterium]